jgi:hypothetical protein
MIEKLVFKCHERCIYTVREQKKLKMIKFRLPVLKKCIIVTTQSHYIQVF